MKLNIKKILLFAGFMTLTSLLFFTVSANVAQAGDWANLVKSLFSGGWLENIGNLVLKLGAATIAIGAWALEFFLWIIFELVVDLVQDLFNPDYYRYILGGFAVNPMVIRGWKVVAAICNMLYIIVLLFIGVGTLFRIEKYNYKKLLIKLIVVALLTNFSLVFAGIILDFFHILMFNGAFGDPLGNIEEAIKKLMWGPFNRRWETFKGILDAPSAMAIAGIVAGSITQLIFMAMVSIVVLAIGIFLIIRTVALWVLLVLSPVAYIGLVLPDTEGTAKKWWSSFLKYAMAGPILFFFLWFSAEVINEMYGKLVAQPNPNDLKDMVIQNQFQADNFKHLGDKGFVDPIVTSHNTYAYMMFASVLLWGSIIAAASLSIAGASKVTRMAQIAVLGGALLAQKVGGHTAGWAFKGVGERLKGVKPAVTLGPNASLWEKTKVGAMNIAPTLGKGFMGASGVAKTVAVLEPISIGRALYIKYKKIMDAQGKEDEESVRKLGGIAWLAAGHATKKTSSVLNIIPGINITPRTKVLETAGNTEDKRRAAARTKNENERSEIDNEDQSLRTEESTLNSEENNLNNEESTLVMGGAGRRRKEEIENRKNKIASQRDKIVRSRGELQGRKDKLITEWNTNDLGQDHDTEYRKAAIREVYNREGRSLLYDDRVRDAKVATVMDTQRQENRTVPQMSATLSGARTAKQKEGLLRLMAAAKINITEELHNSGILAPDADINDYIDANFKGNNKRSGDLLRADLDNLARENKHYEEIGSTTMDDKTKQIRPATSEERVQTINRIISGQDAGKYANTFKSNLIVKAMPDGTRKLADTAQVAIKNMTNGFIDSHKKNKTIATKEIGEIRKLLKNTRLMSQLSTEAKSTLEKLKDADDYIPPRPQDNQT